MFKNFLIAKEKIRPDYFLYENNKSAAQPIKDQIAKEFGVTERSIFSHDNGVRMTYINSALVSAQNRERFYVTNFGDIEQPEDRGILLRDILETGITDKEKAYCLKHQAGNTRDYFKKHHTKVAFEPVAVNDQNGKSRTVKSQYARTSIANTQYESTYGATMVAEPIRIGTTENSNNPEYDSKQYRVYSPDGKSTTLCGQGGGAGAKTGLYAVPCDDGFVKTPAILRYERTEKAKELRKSYESHEIKHGFNEHRELHPRTDGKSNTLSTVQKDNLVIEYADGTTKPIYEVRNGLITIKDKQYPIKLADGYYIIRKLTVTECMRLQTIPEWYIMPCSASQNYKMLGNGWTVEVIMHLLSHIPNIRNEEIEVLSMYDGMSCGQIALMQMGCNVKRVYATEIDKYAIQTTQHNFPDTIQLGDAFQVRDDSWHLPV